MDTNSLNPERWQRVKALLAEALEREPRVREEFLRTLAGRDPTLADEVRSLLGHYERADGSPTDLPDLPDLPFVLDAAEDEGPSLVGRVVGAYRLVELIGRGGMGAVYRGVRDEDGKQVAVKFLRGGEAAGSVLRRFQAERRILAGLEHEHIAGLIDGGRTEEGWPYFTLEYVPGRPITDWCTERGLATPARLQLFRRVCAAVHYAHQRLVVHRDIKPGNILVTEDGVPKLLDFGIAKLLSGASEDFAAATLTLNAAMTPQYASPEQVRGEPITTATDVYALGLLLYELLTGKRAQSMRTLSPEELVRAVCASDPPLPSTIVGAPSSRQLAGDLDAIVMKALRKEPARRYASAQELSEDVRRHLEAEPVSAHGGAWSYRAGKLLRRRRGAVVAAGLVLVTLVLGVAATLRQARVAEANRALAQKRYDDVRQLASSFLFEFHDAIRDLPGATKARKLVVAKALEYLGRLSEPAGNDLGLMDELATAYQRVGDVQGSPWDANLGDTAGAHDSYAKAVSLAERLVAAEPGRPAWRATLARALQRRGVIETALGQTDAAFATLERATSLFERLLAETPGDRKLRRDLHLTHVRLGDVYRERQDWSRARPEFEAAQRLAEQNLAADASDVQAGRDVGVALARQADVQKHVDPPSALAIFRRLLATDETRAALDPDSAQYQRDLAADHEDVAQTQQLVGDLPGALAEQHKALAIRERLLTADPQNEQALQDVSVSHSQTGDVLLALQRRPEALASYRRSLAIDAQIAKRNPASERARDYEGSSHANVAGVLLALGAPGEALEHYHSALALCGPVAAAHPDDVANRAYLADLHRQTGDAHVTLARAGGAESGAHWRAGREQFVTAAAEWEELRKKRGVDDAELRKADELKARLRACDAALAERGR